MEKTPGIEEVKCIGCQILEKKGFESLILYERTYGKIKLKEKKKTTPPQSKQHLKRQHRV